MSKRAEQKALEAYPAERGHLHDRPFQRDGFVKGYEQAEKDLALTWEDIKTIEQIIATSDWYDFEINGKLWSKEFYEEVLNRFNKSKEE